MSGTGFNSFFHYFQSGGYVMYPLVLVTVILWFAIGYRIAVLKRGTPLSPRELLARDGNGASKTSNGIVVRAAKEGIGIRKARLPYLRQRLDCAFALYINEVRSYSVLIKALVMVAPLLGLLGTVSGMIETFDSLGEMALFTQGGGIAGGISEALLTTQLGLAIAVPGLLIKGTLDRKQRVVEVELAQLKDLLCADDFPQQT